MGQNTSSQRQLPRSPASSGPAQMFHSSLGGDRRTDEETTLAPAEHEGTWEDLRRMASIFPSSDPRSPANPQSEWYSTYRREVRARSTMISDEAGNGETRASVRDDVLYEQEERPLIFRNIEDLQLGDAPITNITAAPMPRRPSVISRLGSRIMPRHTFPEPLSAGRDYGEGRSVRRRLSRISSFHPMEPQESRRHRRFSVLGLPSPPSLPLQRNRLAPISRPISLSMENSPAHLDGVDAPRPAPTPDSSRVVHRRSTSDSLFPEPRASRLSRIRRSISTPLESLIPISRTSRNHRQPSLNAHPAHWPLTDETTHLIPPLPLASPRIDMEDVYPRSEGNPNRRSSGAMPSVPESQSLERPSSWTQRSFDAGTDGQPPSVRRENRRIRNLLGGRSSRLIRRDDETPLSRILQLAAAAIVAQLSGNTDVPTDLQSIGDDNFDGSLNAFIQSLNDATSTGNRGEAAAAPVASVSPLNFWRVFRFVSPDPQRRDEQSATREERNPEDEHADNRLVTLVVVGVRSVPSSSIVRESTEGFTTSLDTLLSLSTTSLGEEGQVPTNTGHSGSRRHHWNRRATVQGVNPFPSQYESQRHQRTIGNRLSRSASLRRRTSGLSASDVLASTRIPFSDSPEGLHAPPPSTPADPYLSAHVSGSTTPSHQSADMSLTNEPYSGAEVTDHAELSNVPQAIRYRRRSDSDYARHGHLGSGAARRNGVVEPDGASATGRHWLIYVVGTNLSEDHPAFQAPSLFTDNPTYEDMVMLSALLGPAKPPVASAQDVATASGVYRIGAQNADGTWTARAINAPGVMQLPQDLERCLVCLSEYDQGEEIRKLQTCNHIYHRECIDTWLTTGRNSCPLCRGQGVKETAPTLDTPTPEIPTAEAS